jgi:hypothetical protein
MTTRPHPAGKGPESPRPFSDAKSRSGRPGSHAGRSQLRGALERLVKLAAKEAGRPEAQGRLDVDGTVTALDVLIAPLSALALVEAAEHGREADLELLAELGLLPPLSGLGTQGARPDLTDPAAVLDWALRGCASRLQQAVLVCDFLQSALDGSPLEEALAACQPPAASEAALLADSSGEDGAGQ